LRLGKGLNYIEEVCNYSFVDVNYKEGILVEN
jgi:hypothetical protein